jgi:hypothetical protein
VFYAHLFILTVAGAFIHLFTQKGRLGKQRVIEVFLLYFIVLYCGIGQLVPGLLHIALPDLMAAYTGWPAGNPFQVQLGFAHITFAVLGILSMRIRGNFWVATVLGCAIFMAGNAAVHIGDLLLRRNLMPLNAGFGVAGDLVVPFILLSLLLLHGRLSQNRPVENGALLHVIAPEIEQMNH